MCRKMNSVALVSVFAVLCATTASLSVRPAIAADAPKAAKPAPAIPDAATLLKPGKPSGPQGDTWASIAQLPDLTSTKWTSAPAAIPAGPISHIRDTSNWTPAWLVKVEAANKISAVGGDVPSRAYHCIPGGYSGGLGGGVGGDSLTEFLITPGQVTVIPETWQGRRIYTNGRKHPADPDTTFSGDNIGHWENGALVVDTIGLDPGNEITYGIPGGNNMHVVQRIWLTDANTLAYASVLEAPEAMIKPRVSQGKLVRNKKWEMHEQYCAEANNDVGADGKQTFDLTPPAP